MNGLEFGKCPTCKGEKRTQGQWCSWDCEECGGDGLDTAMSDTMHSNVFTARASGQYIPAERYTMPDHDTRLLRARLILEEAVETIKGLGFSIWAYYDHIGQAYGVMDDEVYTPDLEQIIDGCCDVQYVTTGTLVACGVPDEVHIAEVTAANARKYPGGVAVPHPTIPGKMGKPPGWVGPDHKQFFPKKDS